jgi:hypothetical protein
MPTYPVIPLTQEDKLFGWPPSFPVSFRDFSHHGGSTKANPPVFHAAKRAGSVHAVPRRKKCRAIDTIFAASFHPV